MRKFITLMVLLCSITITAQDYRFGKVSKAELEEKVHPIDSSANAAYLYKHRRTYFTFSQSQGFLIVNEIHERIKIYNKDGFLYATREIPYYYPESGSSDKITGIKALTYNSKEGKVSEEKLSKKDIFETKINENYKMKKITMPEVKEGSVIEIKYKITSPYIYSIDDLQFQYGVPVNKLEYSIAIPEYYKFNQMAKGYYSIVPENRTVNSRQSFTTTSVNTGRAGINSSSNQQFEYKTLISEYKAENIPALKDDEPYVGSVRSYRGGISYELTAIQYPNSSPELFSTSWDKVTKQIYTSTGFGKELTKSNFYEDDLSTLLASANNDIEKIVAIYQFVKSKVKWNGSYGKYSDGLKKAYKEGSGSSADINLMLTSMLRSANLNADPVLVSSRNNGVPLFPTINGFDYVISIVFIGDKYLLLDATEAYGEPNVLPVRALNWNGRVVRKDGSSSWVPLTSSKFAEQDHFVNATIDIEDGAVNGMMRSKYLNLSALSFRNRFNGITEESMRSKFEEDYNIEIEDLKVQNKLALGKPVARVVKFSSEDLLEEINGKIYIDPLLFFTSNVNPFKADERKYPVDFNSPWKRKYMISLELPEGYSVETIPEDMAIGMSDRLGFFKYVIKQAGNKISVLCSLQINQGKINPTYYNELKDFYKKMIEKQTEKIVLVKS